MIRQHFLLLPVEMHDNTSLKVLYINSTFSSFLFYT